MTFLGINANKILNKIDSFENWVKEKSPAVFIIQETKVPSIGQIQTNNTKQYQFYKQIRLSNPALGGGLCIGVTRELHSTLLRDGGEEVECLTVQLEVGQQELVVVCGYGPQENSGICKKELFWQYLEREVEEASREEKMLLIQMDANAWLGNNTIPGDPNIIPNSNGKLFARFLERNENLILVNSQPICEGVITRQRITEVLHEKSAIDVFLVCKKLFPFVTKLFIDERRVSPLTNFSRLMKSNKVTETDHNKLELYVAIEAPIIKPSREVLFNFKTKYGQHLFKNLSSNSEIIRNCFKSDKPLEEQASTFQKDLNNIFHKSFQKIRGRKQKIENPDLDFLFKERKRLKQELPFSTNNSAQNNLEEIDKNICNIISDKNRDKIHNMFKNISNLDDSCSTLGMWKEIKKLFPKIQKTVPSGIRNHKGTIVTKSSKVKQIISRKYKIRLRRRPSNPEVMHIMKIKEENAKRIICLSREIKTLPWTSEELHKVLKSLKNDKCRDPYGMINELFKPGVIGSDLQIALLDLFNLCKTKMQIPEFLKTSNIVNVWKKKGDKMDIDSYRGIFVTNIFKAVLL